MDTGGTTDAVIMDTGGMDIIDTTAVMGEGRAAWAALRTNDEFNA